MNKIAIGIWLFLNSFYIQADTITVPHTAVQSVETKIRVDEETAIENLKFTPSFKKAYQSNSQFNYKTVDQGDSLWTRIKNGIQRWLNRLFNSDAAETPKQLWNTSLDYIAVVVLIGLIAFVIRAFIKKDALWLFKRSKKTFDIVAFDVEKNLEQTNFRTLIDQALHNHNNRLAIRYYYLWLLQVLSKKEVIKWDLEKTNSDYLSEIKDLDTRQSFQYLSYLYNNIWYGEFEVDPLEFKKAQQTFESFLKLWSDE